MLTIQFPFKNPTTDWPNHPFPARFAREGYVLYHGTSSSQEDAIEANGLIPTVSRFEKADLQRLVAIFNGIGWEECLRSYGVLTAFSLGHDFAHVKGKPIYLASGSKRALLYASFDFAGGEIARAVRYSFQDLRSYLEDPAVRAAHIAMHEESMARLQQRGGILPPLPDYEPLVLKRQLEEMTSIEEVAVDAERTFTHGVVYAVQIEHGDLHDMEYSPSMGIKCHKHLPPEQLIAKVHVPPSYEHNPSTRDADRFDLPSLKGVVEALRSKCA